DGSFCPADELVALLILPPKDPSPSSDPASRHQRHDPQQLVVTTVRLGDRMRKWDKLNDKQVAVLRRIAEGMISVARMLLFFVGRRGRLSTVVW
uniref:hypothetical protein n=1 Tax=Saccharopolyspora galaxeae TaxID=2781241 RepID=UPI001F23BB60